MSPRPTARTDGRPRWCARPTCPSSGSVLGAALRQQREQLAATSCRGVALPSPGVAAGEDGDREFASFSIPAESFRYSPNLQTATVHPHAPFSGVAHFDRRKRANRRWSGDLTIDMPGLSNAALTG